MGTGDLAVAMVKRLRHRR